MHQRLEHYSHDQVHGSIVKRSTIEAILTQLLALTIEERKQLPGLEPGRADVIPIGATLLCETMDLFGYDQVTISDRGVRWGLLYEALGC